MNQKEIDRQRIEQETNAFLASGGSIEKLGHWVGENGYPIRLNRDTKRKVAARIGRQNAAKMTHRSV